MPRRSGTHSETLNHAGSQQPSQAARDLERDLVFYKFIMDSVPIAIVTMDSALRITEFNHWAEKITGYLSEEAVGRHCWEILHSGMCGSRCPLRAVLDRKQSTLGARTTIHNKDGKILPVQFNAAALFDAEGRLIGGVEAFVEISKLVAMERERSNFISMLAHDMRSSLTGIHGLGLRLLRKLDDLTREEERKHLEIITKEAATLESLVDDFIQFSRIETGRLQLNITATSLDRELEEIFDTYRMKADQQGLRLELQIDDVLPVIEADADRLRRVLTNLLDNAIKFSRENGRIIIAAREKGGDVLVTVTDEGIGIDPEDLPHIFEAFHRGRTTGGREGHGLGLATVKAIVEGHGGRILVDSRLGEGTSFTVVLPVGRDPSRHSDGCGVGL